jgi:hypothetical protein
MSSCGAAPSPATMSSKRGNLPLVSATEAMRIQVANHHNYTQIEGLRVKWKEEFQ